MAILHHLPPVALRSYVHAYWQIEHHLSPGQVLRIPFGCTGHAHMAFCLGSPYHIQAKDAHIIWPATVYGQMTKPYVTLFCALPWKF